MWQRAYRTGWRQAWRGRVARSRHSRPSNCLRWRVVVGCDSSRAVCCAVLRMCCCPKRLGRLAAHHQFKLFEGSRGTRTKTSTGGFGSYGSLSVTLSLPPPSPSLSPPPLLDLHRGFRGVDFGVVGGSTGHHFQTDSNGPIRIETT